MLDVSRDRVTIEVTCKHKTTKIGDYVFKVGTAYISNKPFSMGPIHSKRFVGVIDEDSSNTVLVYGQTKMPFIV